MHYHFCYYLLKNRVICLLFNLTYSRCFLYRTSCWYILKVIVYQPKWTRTSVL